MRRKINQLAVFAMLLAVAACSKDEFTQAPFDPQDTSIVNPVDTPVVEPPACTHYKHQINIDSLAQLISPVAVIGVEMCDCDTMDIELINIPEFVIFDGWFLPGSLWSDPSTIKKNITGDSLWFVGVADTAAFGKDYSFIVTVDVDSCSTR